MSNPERLPELPATPAQAQLLFSAVKRLTASRGAEYGDRNSTSFTVDEVPSAILEHLPPVDDLSTVSYSGYATHIFKQRAEASRNPVTGIVSITQSQQPRAGVIYAAHANYHITMNASGETDGLERHVTNTEHGLHMIPEFRVIPSDRDGGVPMIEIVQDVSPEEQLASLVELKRNIEQARPIEEALGIFVVSQLEAAQLIEVIFDTRLPS